jgi:homoserine kinase
MCQVIRFATIRALPPLSTSGGSLEEEDVIDKVVVSVPASTANLGPGFDAFGLALEMRSIYTAEVLPSTERWNVHFEGMGADVLNEKGFKFVGEVMEYFERAESIHLPPVSINVQTGIPLTRGLGSSASAIVGLLSCFEVMMNTQFDTGKVLKYAIGIEGHPDNVTASLVGGFTIAASDKAEVAYMKVIPQNLKVVVTVPSSFLSTKKARACLPDMYARRDAVFNIGRASMLSACIFSGNYDLLSFALHDRMHQHYREKLVTGFKEVSRAADRAGAYGAFLSGAGPSIAALATPAKAEKVAKAMQKAMIELDPEADTYVLDIATQGVILQPGSEVEQ